MQVVADRPEIKETAKLRNIFTGLFYPQAERSGRQGHDDELHLPHWWSPAEQAPRPARARSHLNKNTRQSGYLHGDGVKTPSLLHHLSDFNYQIKALKFPQKHKN